MLFRQFLILQLSMNPAFTPTSVIRKMANDKLDKTDDVTSSEEVLAPNVTPVVSSASYMPRQSRAMTSINSVGSGLGDASNDDSGVGVLSDHSADMSSVHLPNVPHNTPQSALSFPQQQPTSIDLQKVQAQLEQLGSGPSVPATGGSASAKLPRALFGQGSMSQPHSGVKGLAQLSNATPQQQQRSAQIQQQLFVRTPLCPSPLPLFLASDTRILFSAQRVGWRQSELGHVWWKWWRAVRATDRQGRRAAAQSPLTRRLPQHAAVAAERGAFTRPAAQPVRLGRQPDVGGCERQPAADRGRRIGSDVVAAES